MNKIFNYLYELLQQFFPGNVIENVKNIKLFYYKKLTMDKQRVSKGLNLPFIPSLYLVTRTQIDESTWRIVDL